MADRKQIFADTLVDLLKEKPLDKITVTELVERCGVTRQAFYYHFSDIYEIVEWILLKETQKIVDANSDIDTWQIGYTETLQWVKEHRNLVVNTYRAIGKEYVEYFVTRFLRPYVIKVVEREFQEQEYEVTAAQREFIVNFFTLAINAVTVDWVRNGMKEAPETMADYIHILTEGDIKKSLQNFQKTNQEKNA